MNAKITEETLYRTSDGASHATRDAAAQYIAMQSLIEIDGADVPLSSWYNLIEHLSEVYAALCDDEGNLFPFAREAFEGRATNVKEPPNTFTPRDWPPLDWRSLSQSAFGAPVKEPPSAPTPRYDFDPPELGNWYDCDDQYGWSRGPEADYNSIRWVGKRPGHDTRVVYLHRHHGPEVGNNPAHTQSLARACPPLGIRLTTEPEPTAPPPCYDSDGNRVTEPEPTTPTSAAPASFYDAEEQRTWVANPDDDEWVGTHRSRESWFLPYPLLDDSRPLTTEHLYPNRHVKSIERALAVGPTRSE